MPGLKSWLFCSVQVRLNTVITLNPSRDVCITALILEQYEIATTSVYMKDVEDICYLVSLITGNTDENFAQDVKSVCRINKVSTFVNQDVLNKAIELEYDDLFMSRSVYLFSRLTQTYKSTYILDLLVTVHKLAKETRNFPKLGSSKIYSDTELQQIYIRLWSQGYMFFSTRVEVEEELA